MGAHQAIFNGDVALRPSETQRVIDAIEKQGLVFQAFHQHLYDLTLMVWFIHFRASAIRWIWAAGYTGSSK